MKLKGVKVKIGKARYVKVCEITPAHFHDDLLFSHTITFVRWSKTEGKLIITKIALTEEAVNAMLSGFYSLATEEKKDGTK